MTVQDYGYACLERCCAVIYDDEIGLPGPHRSQVSRPMYEVIRTHESSENLCFEFGEPVEDWDFQRPEPEGFQPSKALVNAMRALVNS